MKKFFKTPLPVRWIFRRRVWGFSRSKCVYLTFDDGPTEELSDWILDYLKEQDVKATFFCVGANVKRSPDKYKRILLDGHQVGNHTMYHEKGTETPVNDYLNSINAAAELIDSNLFRPPYGRMPLKVESKLPSNYKVIMWSWLSYDYDKSVPVADIIDRAEKQIKGGDILVLHDNIKVSERIKELLPEVIRIVRSKGLEFDIIAS